MNLDSFPLDIQACPPVIYPYGFLAHSGRIRHVS